MKTTKNITLSLAERITLPGTLPQQGSYIDLLVCKDLQRKIELKQQELDDYEVRSLPNGMLGWNAKGVEAQLNVALTEREHELLTRSLRKADEAATLPTTLMELYAKLCTPSIPEDLLPTPKITSKK